MSRKKIMVVEDEYTIRETLKEFLELEGYAVSTAHNGKDALDKMNYQELPDLILIDMIMPIMNGEEFLKTANQNAELAKIPVIVVSATASADNIADAKAFIKKPPDLDYLLKMIEKYI